MKTSVLVVGAGPYGFGIAQELWHRGVDVAVVGEPFATWHRHTLAVMSLRSDPRGSSVWSPDDRYSFPDFLREAKERGELDETEGDEDVVPVSLYRKYLRRVEERAPFPIVRSEVTELDVDEQGRFHAVGTNHFTATARAVVVATGLGGHRHLPTAFRKLPARALLHSWDVDRIEGLADRRVLVVGGGQSAAETVDSLRRRNQVTWAMKRPPFFFREPLRVPTPLFKLLLAGSTLIFKLPPPILRALGRATFRTTITPSLEPVWRDESVAKLIRDADGLGLEPRKSADDEPAGIHCAADDRVYDAVVSATGYRYSLAGLPFLSRRLAARVAEAGDPPKLRADFSTTVPGLYLVGGIAEPTHGPAMRFVLGARHAARTLGRRLPAKLAELAPLHAVSQSNDASAERSTTVDQPT